MYNISMYTSRRRNTLILRILLGLLWGVLCLFSNNIHADCDSTSGTHYPTIMPPNYQGSAHYDTFDCAVNGSKQLTLEEINERSDLMPPKLTNRFYIRIGANAAAEGISGANNQEINISTNNQQGNLSNTRNKVASNNFEMAFGYVWKDFAFDLEWLASKSVDFNTNVININPSFAVSSNVKGDALLGNIYWIFNDMYNVKLYADFIVGWSQNTSTTFINGGGENTFKRNHFAFGLGIGARFNIWSKLFADINGRYIYLGTARLVSTNGAEHCWIKVNRTWIGAAVCLLWVI